MLEHLPERDRPAVKARLRGAWATDDHALALDGLQALAAELDRSHPGAAARCATACTRRSPSPASGSAGGSSARFRARTRSSR